MILKLVKKLRERREPSFQKKGHQVLHKKPQTSKKSKLGHPAEVDLELNQLTLELSLFDNETQTNITNLLLQLPNPSHLPSDIPQLEQTAAESCLPINQIWTIDDSSIPKPKNKRGLW